MSVTRLGSAAFALAGLSLLPVAVGVSPAMAQSASSQGTPAGSASTDAAAKAELPLVAVEGQRGNTDSTGAGYVIQRSSAGGKTDQPLVDAPQSISVIPRDQMDDQGVQTVSQALRYTPGVIAEARPGGRYDTVFLRGFGGFGNSASYASYLDGLRLLPGQSYAIPTIDPYLLDRVEVVRGPASVLYGQLSPGGLVNMASRMPVAHQQQEVRLEAGSNGRIQGAFDVGGAANKDGTVLFRITGVGRHADSQIDYAKEERLAIAPAVTWKPDSKTSLTLMGSYDYEPNGGFYGFLPAVGTAITGRYGKLPTSFNSGDPGYDRFTRTQYSIGYKLEHRFDDVFTARQNFRYMHIDTDFRGLSVRGISTDQSTITRAASNSIEHLDAISLDNQLEARFGTGPLRHVVVGGLDYQQAMSSRRLGQATTTSLSLLAPVYYQNIALPAITQNTQQTQRQIGLYAQDQISLDRWLMVLGVRQDWLNTDTDQILAKTSTSTTDSKATWRAALMYRFDMGLSPYFSYSTSFQPTSGTLSPARGGGAFRPTTGNQYEVGVKYQPPGHNSLITLSGFDIHQQNVLTTDPNNSSYSIQTGEIRSRGIELEGRADLGHGLNLIASYTYLDAVVTKGTTTTTGNRPAAVPNHIASIWADYKLPEQKIAGVNFGGLSVGGGYRLVGGAFGDAENTFKVGSYGLFDAALNYDLGHASRTLKGATLTLNVSNLFDKEYVAACSSTTTCFYGLRRTVLGGLRYRW